MSHGLNWNEMSSDEDESSHNDQQSPVQQRYKREFPVEENAQSKKEQQQVKEEIKPIRVERPEKKRNFLTDQQLLNKYLQKSVDDPKAIKVSCCYNQEAREVIKNLKNARIVELNQSNFLLFFTSEEGLIEFFKEKLAKKYKFYFNMFQNRRKEGDDRNRGERKDTRRFVRAEKEDRGRQGEKEDDRRQRREQKKEKEEEVKEKRQKEEQKPEKEEETQERKASFEEQHERKNSYNQQKAKKTYLPKQSYELQQHSNILLIHSDNFDVKKVLQSISRKKIYSQFCRFIIKAPFFTFPKVSILCQQIAKHKYFLQTNPPTEADKEAILELSLVEGGKNYTTQFYERYNQKKEATSKQKKEVKQAKQTKQVEEKKETKEKQRKQVREEPKVKEAKETKQIPQSARLLGTKFDDYFKQINKHNLSEIVKGFDEHEYIKRLRDANPEIQKNWNAWKIQAEENYIQVLLKLTYRLKKSTMYDIELKPSLRNEKAVLTAELKQRPENERRPKVDVSNVNNYLS